jgi:hypothetical protein
LPPAAIEALVPNVAQTASTISAVVVSSQLIANRESSRRRLMPRASARATTAFVSAQVSTVIVSK